MLPYILPRWLSVSCVRQVTRPPSHLGRALPPSRRVSFLVRPSTAPLSRWASPRPAHPPRLTPRFPPAQRRRYNYNPYDTTSRRPRVIPTTARVVPPTGGRPPPPPPPQRLRRLVRAPSTRGVVVLAVLAAVVFYYAHLEVVPVSGRRRFNCFGEASVQAMADMQYRRVLDDIEKHGRVLSGWDARTRMVQRVMQRLMPVSGMEGVEWEVRVIDDPGTANAFVLPGGKVFVFSGIFPLARNETGLAAVLGHEMAHNLADHIAERLSAAIGENILLGSLLMLSLSIPGGWLAVGLFGDVALDLLFGRPMGRLQESEADYIGLMMMAEACYDPREAVAFWQRMDRAQQQQPPEWLSTHPSNQNRIEKIQKWLPKAVDKMNESDCHGTQGFAEQFRRAMRQGIIIGE